MPLKYCQINNPFKMSRFHFLYKIINVKKSNIFTYATCFSHSLFVPSSIKISLKNFHLFLNLFLTVSCVFTYEYICVCVVYIHTVHYICVYTYGSCWLQSPLPTYLPSIPNVPPSYKALSHIHIFLLCFVMHWV